MQLNGLTVIGCDGANVNRGNKGGINRLMEQALIDHYNGEFVCFKQMSYLSVIYEFLSMEQQLVLKNFVDSEQDCIIVGLKVHRNVIVGPKVHRLMF
ncbi:hypothetical protein AVEN_82486-1 [Araneus ventricosus]|uniref:Uncharacterized protein n=1 Tax=Araneus ventricosus TaxID=182803 RepID=A0A4Y2KTA6_ARAVE|nr:hypothetical protein AVEN_82486-1 [Araneus ventricosus]